MAMAPPHTSECGTSAGEEQDSLKLHEIGAATEFQYQEDANALEFGDISYDLEQVNYFPGELVDHWMSFSSKGSYHCYSLGLNLMKHFDDDVAFRDILLIVKCDLGTDFTHTSFPLGSDVSVHMAYVGVIHLSIDEVAIARRFQMTVLRMLIDRKMTLSKNDLDGLQQEETISRSAYLLLPLVVGNQNFPIIDWSCVGSCLFPSGLVSSSNMGIIKGTQCCCSPDGAHLMQTKYVALCRCMLRNSLVFTPHHNDRVYYINGIMEDLNGNSFMKIAKKTLTYKNYYESRHRITLRNERESLLHGKPLSTVRNWLQRRLPVQKEKKESNNFVELPPELCVVVVSNISISTLRSFSFIPSIMHRIESMLLAARLKIIQMNHYTQNVIIPSSKVLEAITTKKCQEEFCLESLETLGDSFLKYATSQQLFRDNIHDHEGLLSAKKDKIISNAALCKLGCEQKLQGFIHNEVFNPKTWIIPGEQTRCLTEYSLCFSTSKVIYSKGTKVMKSRVVADVVEALIGAYLSTCGELAALYLMKWLGMKIEFVNEMPNDGPFLEKPHMYVNVNHLEELLKYKFHTPSLLVEALTHRSYQLPEIPRCYERLEFLGDAVLDYLITVHLYNQYPGLSPEFLTDLRSASVNNECYAHATLKAELNKHIIHDSSALHGQIANVVQNFAQQSFSQPIFGWEAEIELPKVLGDIIESIAGAILVDSGFNKDAVWKSIKPLLEPLVTPDTIKYQPVKELEELCRRKSYGCKYIRTLHDGISCVIFEVQVDGILYSETRSGLNKKATKKLAAKALLDKLKASNHGI